MQNLLRSIAPLACLAVILSLPRPATAETLNETGVWTALFANGELLLHQDAKGNAENPWRWWYDGQLRWFEEFDGFGQTIVRPGIGYKVTDKMTLWGGYAWAHIEPLHDPPIDEHQFWQQITWSHKFDPATLDLRSRLEQRFREEGDDTGWRFRQMFAYRQPLEVTPRLTFVMWDEVFFNLNDTDWGSHSGFDQNRAFVGLGWKPTPETTWRVEVGYLNQFIDRVGRANMNNHLLSISLFWNP
ncbi:MAG: DUF2490 domain-containing protein [Planctomycetota bacterium]|nr:DUF2490 domain-containing protein [Planctomycetota bacterium]